MDSLTKIKRFFSYWYMRYLLATELYMVETWEKSVVHLLFMVLFGMVWSFNYFVLVKTIFRLRSPLNEIEMIAVEH